MRRTSLSTFLCISFSLTSTSVEGVSINVNGVESNDSLGSLESQRTSVEWQLVKNGNDSYEGHIYGKALDRRDNGSSGRFSATTDAMPFQFASWRIASIESETIIETDRYTYSYTGMYDEPFYQEYWGYGEAEMRLIQDSTNRRVRAFESSGYGNRTHIVNDVIIVPPGQYTLTHSAAGHGAIPPAGPAHLDFKVRTSASVAFEPITPDAYVELDTFSPAPFRNIGRVATIDGELRVIWDRVNRPTPTAREFQTGNFRVG